MGAGRQVTDKIPPLPLLPLNKPLLTSLPISWPTCWNAPQVSSGTRTQTEKSSGNLSKTSSILFYRILMDGKVHNRRRCVKLLCWPSWFPRPLLVMLGFHSWQKEKLVFISLCRMASQWAWWKTEKERSLSMLGVAPLTLVHTAKMIGTLEESIRGSGGSSV